MSAPTPEHVSEHVDATNKLLADLSAKLQAAAEAGDPNARAWQLDLREAALSVREESILASSLASPGSLAPVSAQSTAAELAAASSTTASKFAELQSRVKAGADAGNQNAREWQLDLREIALSSKETSMMAASLARSAGLLSAQNGAQPQTGFAAPAPASPYAAPPQQYPQPSPYAAPPQQYQQPQYQPQQDNQPPQYPQQAQHNQGGMFSRFRNSSFGSNMINAVGWGVGFQIGEDLVEGVEDIGEGIIDDIF